MQDAPPSEDNLAPVRPVAIVLGAAVWSGGVPSPTLERRACHAAQLWLDGKVSQIIACGGLGQNPPTEAEVILGICSDMGVTAEALHLEDASTTTDENIRFALPLLDEMGRPPVLLVTDLYHAPRARLTALGLGLKAKTSSPKLVGSHPLRLAYAILREGPALALYTWRLLRSRISGSRSR